CDSTHVAAGATVGRISAPNWYENAITWRCASEKPVCDATSGPALNVTFLRQSAITPKATTGSSATMPTASVRHHPGSRAASVSAANIGIPYEYSSTLTSTVIAPAPGPCTLPGRNAVTNVTTEPCCSTARTMSANAAPDTASQRMRTGHVTSGPAKYQMANVTGRKPS